MIQEPQPFRCSWYQHRAEGSGMRYEVSISVCGSIVCVNGPFKCGSFLDIKMFKEGMSLHLDGKEMVVADNGNSEPRFLLANDLKDTDLVRHQCIRARHKTMNERLTYFSVLSSQFRHRVDFHMISFHAVSQVTTVLWST